MSEKPLVFILNGPNLKMLGIREPDRYGLRTFKDLENLCEDEARALGLQIDFRQTTHEGVLVDWLHEAREKAVAVILNAGGYARTSIVLQSTVRTIRTPVIEVHLTNITTREASQPRSLLSPVARGTIFGFGLEGYCLALQAVHRVVVNPPGGVAATS
jgi:3-dehydroquinate dehydratase-2